MSTPSALPATRVWRRYSKGKTVPLQRIVSTHVFFIPYKRDIEEAIKALTPEEMRALILTPMERTNDDTEHFIAFALRLEALRQVPKAMLAHVDILELAKSWAQAASTWMDTDGLDSAFDRWVRKDASLWVDYVHWALQAESPWVIRSGFVMLMRLVKRHPSVVTPELMKETLTRPIFLKAKVEYFVSMGLAWCWVVLLQTFPEASEVLNEGYKMPDLTKRRLVQKMRESYKTTPEQLESIETWLRWYEGY